MELPTTISLQEEPDQESYYADRLEKIEVMEEDREIALERTKKVQEQRKKRYDKRIRHEHVQKET